MWCYAALFVLLAAISQVHSVEQCTYLTGDLPFHVDVNGCDSLPCQLGINRTAEIDVKFRAPRNVRVLITHVTAYVRVGLVTVPIPLDIKSHALACNSLSNTYCPLIDQEVVLYKLAIPIEEFLSVGSTPTLEIRVVDEVGSPVICIGLPVIIVN